MKSGGWSQSPDSTVSLPEQLQDTHMIRPQHLDRTQFENHCLDGSEALLSQYLWQGWVWGPTMELFCQINFRVKIWPWINFHFKMWSWTTLSSLGLEYQKACCKMEKHTHTHTHITHNMQRSCYSSLSWLLISSLSYLNIEVNNNHTYASVLSVQSSSHISSHLSHNHSIC